MTEEDKKKAVCIVSDKGATMMALERMGRDGDNIVIVGRMMGQWGAKMYMSPEDAWRMGGMMIRNRQLVGYIISLPFILRRRRVKKN